MSLAHSDLRNYLPRNLKVTDWEKLKEEDKVYELATEIVSNTITIACNLQGIPLLDEEDVNEYDSEYEEILEEVRDRLIEDNE